MGSVIVSIPEICPVLKAEAVTGQKVATSEEQLAKAAKEAAASAADPCVQVRNEWSSVASASEDAVRAYRERTPAVCPIWRSQAEEKLASFERARQAAAAESERQRQADAREAEEQKLAQAEREKANNEAGRKAALEAAARATGIEGRWVWGKDEVRGCKDFEEFKVMDGGVMVTAAVGVALRFPEAVSAALNGGFPIQAVNGNAVTFNNKVHRVEGDLLMGAGSPTGFHRCK